MRAGEMAVYLLHGERLTMAAPQDAQPFDTVNEAMAATPPDHYGIITATQPQQGHSINKGDIIWFHKPPWGWFEVTDDDTSWYDFWR